MRSRLKNSPQYFLLIIVFIITALNAVTAHISGSEFWPLTLAREFWHIGTVQISLYFKPTFHFVLSVLHFAPLSDWGHIIAAKLIFALMASLSIFLFARWLNFESKLPPENHTLFYVVCVLFLSPLYFSQYVKIRSDLMALFWALALINIVLSYRPPWSSKTAFYIGVVNILLLGSTPRAVLLTIMIFIYTTNLYSIEFKDRKNLKQLLALFLGPLLIAVIPLSTILPALEIHLKNYYLQSFSSSGRMLGHLTTFIQQEPILVFMGFVAGVWSLIQKNIRLSIIFLTSLLAIFLADLKTPFLLASLLPFFLAPFFVQILTLAKNNRFIPAIVLALMLIQSAWLFNKNNWWQSNKHQKEVIVKVSKLIADHPQWSYFDGLGLLPRSPQLMSYLGPDDDIALEYARLMISQQKPDLILYTSRMMLLGDNFVQYLQKNYRAIGPNLFLKNERGENIQIDFAVPPILLFNLSPLQ